MASLLSIKNVVSSVDEYDELLSQWSSLESGLGLILSHPQRVQEFEQRVWQYDRWMQQLLQRDTDVGLYLLFQLATNSPVGYSASHALICGVLAHLLALELKLSQRERDSLVHAAFTMNVAMTLLQDQLATQREKPNADQQSDIRSHASKGSQILKALGVVDKLWLDVVAIHHTEDTHPDALASMAPVDRLTRVLHTIDRYAAMISPRKSRSGRSTSESARAIVSLGQGAHGNEAGLTLIRAIGLCPPGTYVRLTTNEIAVVVRRSGRASHPHVVVLTNEQGEMLHRMRLVRATDSGFHIQTALAATCMTTAPNHHRVLQLGSGAASEITS